MEMGDQLHAPATLLNRGRAPSTQCIGSVGGAQTWSGRGGEKRKIPGIELH